MSNKFKSFIILILIFGATLLLTPHAFAAVDTGLNTINNSIVLSSTSPFQVVTNVINVLMGLLSLIALVLILAGGFIWMTSNGSEEKITTAKKILRNAGIGLVIILSAWGITYFILNKLIDATGGSGNGSNSCTNGATKSCGCDYSGAETCNGNTWGPCLGESCSQIVPGQTSCDGNIGLAQCQADNQLCGTENLCDATDCICKPKASLGDSCNANVSGSCSADDNLCGPYLKCDPNSCVCTGPPVITGISPAGGFCTNDQNRACNLDSDCSGGATCDTLTPNGNTGNFLTIYGYNFGANTDQSNVGTVLFLGGSANQTKTADLPTSLNSTCVNSWTDRQVIVAVPNEVAAGPIEIKRDNSDVNVDLTNDNQGPQIPDFIKNNIKRPGLCQITPTQGLLGDTVAYSGVNLINSEAYFGSYTSSYKGIGSDFSTDNLSGKTLAPSITPGKTTTFVEQTTAGINQKSNALIFVKEKEAAAGPYISSFYPATGAAGQYVTILGSGFGNLRGSRQVMFGNTEASYNFPDVCTNAVWSDGQVIVKVPDGLTSGNYEIKMNLVTKSIDTKLISPNVFTFDPTKELKTSLCKIDPTRGQIGDKVSLWGERFGNQGTDALVVFNRDISTSSKIIKDGNADKIETVVPISSAGVPTITGPVHVAKNGEWGNDLNFTVGKCTSNDECGASSPICCVGNTYKAGSCESSLSACYFDVPNSVYETKFDTNLSGADDYHQFDSYCATLLDEASCSADSEKCCFDATKNICQGGNGAILGTTKSDGTVVGGKCAYYDCGVFDTNGFLDKTQCNQNATTTGQFAATSTCVTNCSKDPKTACDLASGDADACSKLNNCCFDAKNNKCTNGTDKINLAGINYCGYYNCDTDTKTCSGIASTTGQILGQAACEKSCKSVVTLPGLTCAAAAIGVCDTSFCGDPYQCLSVSGSSPTASECGTCCCTPGTKNGDLTCLADQGSCDGSSRGLFCGCTSDTQCGQDSQDSQGCGGDTCCHGRPQVTTTDPKNNDQNVCRNRQIEIDFNQVMNVTTLASNISLVEEKTYGVDTCPSGTTLAFNDFKPKNTNFLARLFDTITSSLKHLFGGGVDNSAIAAAPSPDKLYCVYPITINSKTDYTNNATSTKVYIQPQKILAANTNYFVIIKGDSQLDSNSGVLSLDKVGLNASINSPISSKLDSSIDYSKPNVAVFNGVPFNRSYTFGFTTMSDNSGKNGLCVVNDVVVNPSSFLIKTADNDVSDDNPGDAATFDTINDNDRAVSAFAYSADGQLLQPVSGYDWNWKWNIEDDTVAHKIDVTGLKANQMLVGSMDGVTDKSTKISASIDMSGFSNATFSGNGLSGSSDLYVFLCANPWPMEVNGIWNPWSDKGQCKDANGQTISCLNYNYKFYYCRDAGVAGTADDLPAVADPALILGTSGNLICSTDGSACNAQNASCGSGGTCVWSVLKESYFFREAIPKNGEITEAKNTGAGGQVVLSWYSPIDNSAPVSSFKIYYGLVSGKTSSLIIPLNLTQANCNISGNNNYCSYLINNLVDGTNYYFKVSSLTDKKAESPLSGGQDVIPTDTTAPAKPLGLSVTANNGKVTISWQANTDDALYYRLFHGILAGKKASDSVDSPNKATSLVFDQSAYREGDHYFYLAAIDKSGNVSATSDEVQINVPAAPTNLKVSQNSSSLSLSWDNNNSGLPTYSFLVYGGDNSDLNNVIANTGRYPFYSWANTNYTKGDYYFAVSIKNDKGFESAKSSVVTFNVK